MYARPGENDEERAECSCSVLRQSALCSRRGKKLPCIFNCQKLTETLNLYLNVCKHDEFVHPNIVFFCTYPSIWMYRFDRVLTSSFNRKIRLPFFCMIVINDLDSFGIPSNSYQMMEIKNISIGSINLTIHVPEIMINQISRF